MPSEPVSGELVEMLDLAGVPCRPWPEQEEGPYHREFQPLRRDVVEDRLGVPLQLGIRLLGPDHAALRDASTEIWHCDALGRYSGFPPPDPKVVVTAESAPRTEVAAEETFLRGRQLSDDSGMVEFRTIYPGWYPGRTVHIHTIVHADGAAFTTQLYFPEAVTDDVFAQAPYDHRPGRDTTNEIDEIFGEGGGAAVLDVRPAGGGYCAGACLVVPVRQG
jgi:protocatechuate 3,4-dioxygenase beta subunit